MKALGLDIGDSWTGTAISDSEKKISFPLDSFPASDLKKYLSDLLRSEKIDTVVFGLPYNLDGSESDQLKKILDEVEALKKEFSSLSWVGIDERFTSRAALRMMSKKERKAKRNEHKIAASLILESFLLKDKI